MLPLNDFIVFLFLHLPPNVCELFSEYQHSMDTSIQSIRVFYGESIQLCLLEVFHWCLSSDLGSSFLCQVYWVFLIGNHIGFCKFFFIYWDDCVWLESMSVKRNLESFSYGLWSVTMLNLPIIFWKLWYSYSHEVVLFSFLL